MDKAGRERTGKDTPLNMLQLFCQQPRQWKAYAAKALSDRLSARTVCDSSGGWGDRLTGFLASKSVEDITVIERQLEDAGVSKNLTVLHGPAEMMMADVAGDIDLFLTSPPYLPSERYPGHDGGHGREMEERWKLRVNIQNAIEAHENRPFRWETQIPPVPPDEIASRATGCS